ncbi:hypothetical protein GCM10009416_46200 [Craurococcus roseus]|uniref:Uncharacterized protein n=1 Tax=Craurococcus roseus TaxID=77585 RepID=A0ABP3R462_9PROT
MAGRTDAPAAAALQGVVDADDDRPRRDEGRYHHPQQDAGEGEARPGIAVEHAVEGREAGMLGQAEHA